MKITIEEKVVTKKEIEVEFPLYFRHYDSHNNGEWTYYIRIDHGKFYRVKESRDWGGNAEYEFEEVKLSDYNRGNYVSGYINNDDYDESSAEVFDEVVKKMQLALVAFSLPAKPVEPDMTEAEKRAVEEAERQHALATFCHRLIGKQPVATRSDNQGFDLDFPIQTPSHYVSQTSLLEIITKYIGADRKVLNKYIGTQLTTLTEHEINQTLGAIERERQIKDTGQLWQVAADILLLPYVQVMQAKPKGNSDA
ncbi:hypothetical protein EVC12_197 [Rhizobium phage RHph_I42]|nr:hypothetical protein EVC12_197 [Rhizobium phage RHph_I42]